MIPSLSPVTIGGAPPELRLYIALAESAGFGGVDIDLAAVSAAARASSWDAVSFLFEQYEVGPAAAGLSIDWRKPGDEGQYCFEQTVANLPAEAEAAQRIGCGRICTWLPPAVDDDATEFRARSAARFRQIAGVLADYDLRLGLEFVSPETLRHGAKAMGANEFIYTLPQTLDFIQEIDAPGKNVGLLIDSFHWFCSGSNTAELATLTPTQIVHVHINDAPDRPLPEQMDNERLLPGDGVIDLSAFLTTLAKVGYREFVSVEVFNDELKAEGRDTAAERTGVAIGRVFGQTFGGRG